MDVLADANPILQELGVRFEHSASEATAAATLAASVNYPLRERDVQIHSGNQRGERRAGESGFRRSYGRRAHHCGRGLWRRLQHHAGAIARVRHEIANVAADPRPNLPSIVQAVEQSFEFSEATNLVMLELRIRACHVHGRFTAKDNVRAKFTLADAMEYPSRDVSRIVLPPGSFAHEQEKVHKRWPAAQKFVQQRQLNEFFGNGAQDFGIILQGGMYNTVVRSLELLGLRTLSATVEFRFTF